MLWPHAEGSFHHRGFVRHLGRGRRLSREVRCPTMGLSLIHIFGSRLILRAFWLVLSLGRSSLSMVPTGKSPLCRYPEISFARAQYIQRKRCEHYSNVTIGTPSFEIINLSEIYRAFPGWNSPAFLDTLKCACYGFYSSYCCLLYTSRCV